MDLEKYKPEQGTSRKRTEPTIPTTTSEKVLYIFFTIFTIILSFFKIKKKFFKSSITPLIFTFITYHYFAKKKDPFFLKKQTSYIYFL